MNARWLLPLAVTLHNAEEAIWLPDFRTRHGWNSITPSQVRLAALVSALLVMAVTYAATRKIRTASLLFYTLCWIMLVNVLWHVGACFYFRAYAPGSITAVVIVLPITWYLIFRVRIHDGKKESRF